MTADAHDQNPFVGPRPFERGDSGRFFGRDRETRELASLATAHRTLLLYAPSGAGKTSLVSLLCRFYEYHRGSITFDGVELREWDPVQLREHIGLVLQDVFLFFSGKAQHEVQLE